MLARTLSCCCFVSAFQTPSIVYKAIIYNKHVHLHLRSSNINVTEIF